MHYMYEDFMQNRITMLRLQKKVSARDMSLSLGQNDSYINRIENKKTLPSMQVFFYICDYFGITPQEFFDEGNPNPEQLRDIIEDLKHLEAHALEGVGVVVKEMVGRNRRMD